jgi:hypothetical protein
MSGKLKKNARAAGEFLGSFELWRDKRMQGAASSCCIWLCWILVRQLLILLGCRRFFLLWINCFPLSNLLSTWHKYTEKWKRNIPFCSEALLNVRWIMVTKLNSLLIFCHPLILFLVNSGESDLWFSQQWTVHCLSRCSALHRTNWQAGYWNVFIALMFSIRVLILLSTVLAGAGGVLRPTTCPLSLHTGTSSASGLVNHINSYPAGNFAIQSLEH